MNSQLNKPKGFGQILDQTFRLSKNRFLDFFLIFLILLGPIYLLQALLELVAGTSFFRETGAGGAWYEQFMTEFDGSGEMEPVTPGAVGAGIASGLLGIVSAAFSIIASAAVLFGVNHLRKGEDFTAGKALKQAFSRFWPLVGSSILFFILLFGVIIVPVMILGFSGFFFAGLGGLFTGESLAASMVTILIFIVLFLAAAVGIGYLVTRWSFYIGVVAIDKKAPGIGTSWNLTKGNGWRAFGVYLILMLITFAVSFAFEMTFAVFLGYSVLFTIIINLVTMVTTVITSVGFAVMFFDLKARNDADDLQEMIDEYKED